MPVRRPPTSCVDQVRGVLTGMGWSPDAPTARGQARDRWESLQALVSQATTHATTETDAGRVPTLAGFVAELDRRAHEQHAPVAEGVTLATLHAAKGLEWDAVFLCGMQEGSMPITYADTPAAVEEERRLLYVGVTRAAAAPVGLVVTCPQPRRTGPPHARRASSPGCDPSRPPTAPTAGSTRGTRTRGKKAAVCKQCQKPLASSRERNRGYCQDCPVPYDEELFELLRSWRKEQADAQSVPAFVVFSDATLEALAEVKPTDRQALQSINGIGKAKLEKYADELLALLH